ncbi:Ig-like domain-containing protein [Actinoplanes sp. KI2]|uniref:L,D-transpeptidase n=1 Tax=Actinoplanes sp. KI2 TaxID=2983315 RepID=UPI0021D5CEDE|nr:Ig-like domain-containing protein [Actinoplanes sp. KI2]MCU7722894.1 Ig-like domain-containing protein [Actinoplanes sp. KI2]
MNSSRVGRPWRSAATALIAGVVLLGSGCGRGDKSPTWQGGSDRQTADGSSGTAAPSPSPTLSTVAVVSPAANATGVVAVTEVKYTSDDPENISVTVTDAGGGEVSGTLDKDKQTWRPDKALAYGAKYTVTVNGTAAEGKGGSATSTFTTMAKPSKIIRVTSFLADNQTVGVGMPLIIKFSRAIPVSFRDDVERRLTVTATPAQEGSWGWISPTEVHYRPKVFWQGNSKVFYKAQLGGVPLGNGYYGKSDLTVDLKIGRSFVMTVSNKAKQMTVKQDGKVIKTIPVSLGKPSTPSSSGTMIVMEKAKHTVFDTTDTDPVNGYKTPIDFAQRITWSGQFIHAAPWSEGKQGHVNVSHGCVNVSEKMGAWLFGRTMMGDPITVSGTEQKLKQGNGWTDFNVSYAEWKKLSYLK